MIAEEVENAQQQHWIDELRSILESEGGRNTHVTFIGVGNPIRGDDSVGLFTVSKLRRELGANPTQSVRIEPISSIETTFAKLERRKKKETRETIIIFDAVESNSTPGSIVFAKIDDTKYGFFATHNIPLKLIPTISSNSANVYVLGIQPEDTKVDESLSVTVLAAANTVISTIERLIRGKQEE
jgi:hydrogenase 3 maturation protease